MTFREAAEAKEMGGMGKLTNYFPFYDRYIGPRRGAVTNLFEIGVAGGGSLWTWREFCPNACIVGLDIDAECKQWEHAGKRVHVEIGSQTEGDLLENINKIYGPFDVIIDDGGHQMYEQQTSFAILFPLLKPGGIYVIEDVHTSWFVNFQGRPDGGAGTTIHLLKELVDDVNWWAHRDHRGFGTKPPQKGYGERWIDSIHFHDSIVAIEKKTEESEKPTWPKI